MAELTTILIVLCIVGVVFWIADNMGLPAPVPMAIKGFIGIMGILFLIQHLMAIVG